MDSDSLDDLDLQLLHALQIDGRAAYSTIAEVLGVSARTVARRYGRLRANGLVRVTGVATTGPIATAEWIVRITVRASGATALAHALAQRPDTAWVTVVDSGTEIACIFRIPGDGPAPLEALARHRDVLDISAHRLLHHFMDRRWRGRTSALTATQVEALQPPAIGTTQPLTPTDLDHRLLAALSLDGRAAYPDLARRIGWSETAIRRRLDELRRAGILRFSVEIDPAAFGFTVSCVIWMSVVPHQLQAVATALASDFEAAFIGATTGEHNLIAIAVFRSSAELYTYLTERITALNGIERMETTPIASYTKRDAQIFR
ncbi:AsnC family transcriptional regulator [Nocardia sp. NPDC052112]|uniref:AsnC family transcriptional regulator n=1 Tax=Nocardia sp. NPDC052112 TaxID=3155646 RepID=UPI0034120A34